MRNYILNQMATEAILLGQLTNGKKITKKGFYYGGAGEFICLFFS